MCTRVSLVTSNKYERTSESAYYLIIWEYVEIGNNQSNKRCCFVCVSAQISWLSHHIPRQRACDFVSWCARVEPVDKAHAMKRCA